MEAFAGIDLAIAKKKRLPVAVCSWEAGRLIPRRIAERGDLIRRAAPAMLPR